MTIYYITRTWLPSNTGGSQMRQKQVEILKKSGFNVVIVTPNFKTDEIISTKNIISIPYKFNRIYSFGERIGIYDDYLDIWFKKTFKYLKNIITKNDIVFSTTGGELATFKLGSLLKSTIGCKYIVHYRDPLDYSHIDGRQLDDKFHVDRSKIEYKYIKNADLIYTSSKIIGDNLLKKYKLEKSKIKVNYFGYIEGIELCKKQKRDFVNIAYAGNMSDTQQPEILSKAVDLVENKDKLKVEYVGNYAKYHPIKLCKNSFTKLSGPYEHKKFIKYMIDNVDVGFVSLKNDYLGACVPSKIYEYINLGLPIIGALPDGDAKKLIEDNGFGFCHHYSDLKGISDSINKMINDEELLSNIRKNIINKREEWSMEYRMKNIINDLQNI